MKYEILRDLLLDEKYQEMTVGEFVELVKASDVGVGEVGFFNERTESFPQFLEKEDTAPLGSNPYIHEGL